MRELLPYVMLCLAAVFLASLSQVMLKKAALKPYATRMGEYLNPLVIGAYFIFFGTTVLSLFIYKKLPLNLGPVLESTGYIYITLFGVLVFKEKITAKKLVSIGVIVAGVLIYALA